MTETARQPTRSASDKPDACCLCGRQVPLTFHHLIPRKVHRRTYYRKHMDRETLNLGIYVCRLCHRGIHKLHDEMTLAKELNSLEALKADPDLARHVAWAAKQKRRL